MLKNLQNHISVARDWYNIYKKEIDLTTNITVKNRLLYEELENECKKQGGVLTFSEYLNIEQFGKNGYYATNNQHGQTDIEKRWGNALSNYCLQFGHDTIIEFGCGTGELGVATAKAFQHKTNRTLHWIGVDIDTTIHKAIRDNFATQNMQNAVTKIVTSLDDIPSQKNTLVIFPYSLDNIPPQLFINTSPVISYPNALLGITIGNSKLSEVVMTQDMLHKKGISLKNGQFTKDNLTYKLTSWKLRTGQRAYIPLDSFGTIYRYAKKFTDATFIIIDEFRSEPWSFGLTNLGTPKSLYEKNLVTNDRARYYRQSGQHNFYYPLYKDSLMKFLSTIGFQSIACEVEHKKAASLNRKPWFSMPQSYTTYSFFAKNFVDKKITVLPIIFNPQRII